MLKTDLLINILVENLLLFFFLGHLYLKYEHLKKFKCTSQFEAPLLNIFFNRYFLPVVYIYLILKCFMHIDDAD